MPDNDALADALARDLAAELNRLALIDQAFPFKDAKGRTWNLTINLFGIKRVKEVLGINLLKLSEEKFAKLTELLDDELQLMDVIHVLCSDQFAAQQITDRQFEEAVDGETFGRASAAFLEAYINFSRDPRIRAALRSLKTKGLAAMDLILTEAQKEIDAATPELMVSLWKEKSGISPASSVSIPAPTRSGNSA